MGTTKPTTLGGWFTFMISVLFFMCLAVALYIALRKVFPHGTFTEDTLIAILLFVSLVLVLSKKYLS